MENLITLCFHIYFEQVTDEDDENDGNSDDDGTSRDRAGLLRIDKHPDKMKGGGDPKLLHQSSYVFTQSGNICTHSLFKLSFT